MLHVAFSCRAWGVSGAGWTGRQVFLVHASACFTYVDTDWSSPSVGSVRNGRSNLGSQTKARRDDCEMSHDALAAHVRHWDWAGRFGHDAPMHACPT